MEKRTEPLWMPGASQRRVTRGGSSVERRMERPRAERSEAEAE